MANRETNGKQTSLEECRKFLHGVIAEGLVVGLIRPMDLLRHVSAEMLAEDLPAAIRAKLFSASLRTGTMTPELVVEVVGVQSLVQYLPLDAMWECIAEAAGVVVAGEGDAKPRVRDLGPEHARRDAAAVSGGEHPKAPATTPPMPPPPPRGEERRRRGEPPSRVEVLPGVSTDAPPPASPRPPQRAPEPVMPPVLLDQREGSGAADALPDDPKVFTSEPTRQLVLDDELDEAIFPPGWSNPTPPPPPTPPELRHSRKAADDFVDIVDEPSAVTDPMANIASGKDALSDSLDKLDEWGGEDKTEARNINPRNYR
jgi:hypothetical protein